MSLHFSFHTLYDVWNNKITDFQNLKARSPRNQAFVIIGMIYIIIKGRQARSTILENLII